MLKTPPSHPNIIGWATAIDSQCVNCKWLDWAGIYQFRQNACTTFSAKFMTLLDTCVVELLLVVGKPSTPPPPGSSTRAGAFARSNECKTPSWLSPAFEFPQPKTMYFDFRKETNDAIETNDLDENKKHDNFRRVFARCARTKLTN